MQKKKYEKPECIIIYTNHDEWFLEELESFEKINNEKKADKIDSYRM